MERNLLQHFKPEEFPFIEKAEGWLSLVREKGRWKRTDFLDPRQGEILCQLSRHFSGITALEEGGYEEAERKRFLLFPEGEEPRKEDFQIAYLFIRPKGRFSSLQHRDYLGALLSLGLVRDKFGDLWVVEEGAYLVLAAEIADLVRLQLTEVGRIPVEVEAKVRDEVRFSTEPLKERSITVASLRLDAVLAELLPLSRAKTADLIRGGKVKRNHRIADKTDEEVAEGDLISVRGYGRFHVLEEKGKTKKGNLLLRIGQPMKE